MTEGIGMYTKHILYKSDGDNEVNKQDVILLSVLISEREDFQTFPI